MSSVHRTALSVALAIAPMVATGCVSISAPRPGMSAHQGHPGHSNPLNDTLNSARAAERSGNLAQAKQLYEEAHRQNPQNVESLHRLGVISTMLSQHDRADGYFRDAYKLNPNNAELLADMGYSAFMRNDYERSVAFLQQSFQLNNRDPRTINNLAIALAWRGKDESSLAMFRLANNVPDSEQRLLSIQIARGEKNPGRKGFDQSRSIATATATTPNVPDSKVRTTAYNSTSSSIELPAPITVKSPVELPELKSEVPVSPEIFNLSIPSSPTVTTTTTIELPLPLPIPLPRPAEPATLAVDLIELPAPVAETTRSEATIPAEIPLPPIPPAEGILIPFESNTSLFLPDLKDATDHLAPPLQAETNTTSAAPNLLKTNPPSVWRKTRQTQNDSVIPNSKESSEPVIRQTAGEADSADFKKPAHGICLVTLAEEMRPVAGLLQYEAEYQKELYRFSSQESLEKFKLNPRKYVPAAGGVDVVSVRNDQEVRYGTYNFALRFQRKLYLFTSRENAEEFRRDPFHYVSVD